MSLGLHLAAVTAVLLFARGGVLLADGPEKPIQVELVMEEHKGEARPPTTTTQTQPEIRTQTGKSAKASAPPVQTQTEQNSKAPNPPAKAVSQPPQVPPEPEAPVQETQQAPQEAQQGLTINLQGTDSPSDARAWGDRIIPAKQDAVFHNRPPEYPKEAAMTGERGTVVVMIHVSPAGMTDGVDVVISSGYALLDRSVREAVLRWRFLPAVKDGQPVASDMKMGFIFETE